MEKPISMIMDEFKKSIAENINNSELPMCIIRPILQELLNEAIAAEKQELMISTQKYNESLNENKESDNAKDKS